MNHVEVLIRIIARFLMHVCICLCHMELNFHVYIFIIQSLYDFNYVKNKKDMYLDENCSLIRKIKCYMYDRNLW